MTPDVGSSSLGASSPEVMASVDDASGTPEYVIADVSEEDAWLAMSAADAPELPAWR